MRDQTLDNLRGIAMLQVILVHTVEWTGFASDDWKYTLLLFEMPIFFFVSGALNKINGTYGEYVKVKIVRILKPYYVYASVCLILTLLVDICLFHYNALVLFVTAISWLVPASYRVFPVCPITPIPFLRWALWFPLVYLGVILILPLLKKRKITVVWIAAAYVLSFLLDINYLKYLTFYLFWAFMGFYYKEFRSRPRVTAAISVISLMGVVVLWQLDLPMDMHDNKFPPNFIFGVYSMFTAFGIITLIPLINKAVAIIRSHRLGKTMFDAFSLESLTIFYWQSFAFLFTVPATMILVSENEGMRIIACFIMTVFICVLIAGIAKYIKLIWRNR